MSATQSATVAKLPRAVKAKSAAAPKLTLEAGRIHNLSPHLLQVETGYNVRRFDITNEADKALVDSIKHMGGVQTPLTVRQDAKGNVILVAGHRRLGAVLHLAANDRKAGSTVATVPVMLSSIKNADNRNERNADLFLSNSGKALSPIEMAAVVSRLIEAEYTKPAIAKMGQISTKYVDILLGMANFPPAIQEWIERQNISATLAGELVQKLDKGAQDAPQTILAIRAALDKLTKAKGYGAALRVTEKHFDQLKAPKAVAEASPAEIAAVEAEASSDEAGAERAPRQTVAKVEPVAVVNHERSAPGTATAPVAVAPNGKAHLRIEGARILLDGKVICTFTGNDKDGKLANSRAAYFLKVMESIATGCPR